MYIVRHLTAFTMKILYAPLTESTFRVLLPIMRDRQYVQASHASSKCMGIIPKGCHRQCGSFLFSGITDNKLPILPAFLAAKCLVKYVCKRLHCILHFLYGVGLCSCFYQHRFAAHMKAITVCIHIDSTQIPRIICIAHKLHLKA